MNDKVIVIISSEFWGEVFVSKHHYASFLSQNNTVYFLNPPSIKWQINRLFSTPVKIQKVKNNLFVLDYGNPIPKINKFPLIIQKWVHRRVIRALKSRFIKNHRIDIIWSFDLKRFFDLQSWQAKTHIFHAVELIDHPFFLQDAPHRHEVLKSADIVLSIADLISEQAKPWNSRIVKINHGIDLTEMKLSEKLPNLPGKNKIKAGFVGNFQKSFDFELLSNLSNSHPHVDFIMIGPVDNSNLGSIDPKVKIDLKESNKQNNVFFIGQIPSKRLKYYLSQFNINLVIYSDGFHEGHCNPHKLMSYFYFGKVTVSSFIDEYKSRPDLIQMVQTNVDFLTLFSTVINNLDDENSEEKMNKRREYAFHHSYDTIITKIEGNLT